MKTFILLWVVSSFAIADVYEQAEVWKKASQKVEKAANVKEFVALQKKYPQLLKGIKASQVIKASVTTVKYKFIGTHSCPANDARLFFTGRGMAVCTRQGSSQVCSESRVMPPFGDYDPCQFVFNE